MTDIPIPAEWRYSINYGPEGEANYAFVYDEGGHLVSNLKIHHAIAIVEQMNRRAAQAERMARLEAALRRLLKCEYDGQGLTDCIDNDGCHYPSQELADAIANAEAAVSARALSQEGSDA